jgi:hypothetical protein
MRTLCGHRMTRAILFTATLGLAFTGFNLQAHAGDPPSRKYTPPPPTATIKVTVLRSTNGKPVSNAAVILHPYRNGKDEGALELKSDSDGMIKVDVIPIGDTLRLQVIATGWETFGEDYKIETDSKEIVVKLKRPGPQSSTMGPGDSAGATSTTTPESKTSSATPSDSTTLPQ